MDRRPAAPPPLLTRAAGVGHGRTSSLGPAARRPPKVACSSSAQRRTSQALLVAGGLLAVKRPRSRSRLRRRAAKWPAAARGPTQLVGVGIWDRFDKETAFLKLLLPAAVVGAAAGFLFGPCSLLLRGALAESTQQILQADMTQFMQNAFTVAILLFSLLITDTLGFMFQRQENLHKAIYEEASEVRVLVEQVSLLGAARGDGQAAAALLEDVRAHLEQDLRQLRRPLLPPERRGGGDPLERLLFATSVGMPSSISSSARALRQARATRLASVRRRFPLGHFVILSLFALLVLSFFLILGAGLAGFEPEGQALLPGHLLWLLSPLFGLLVTTNILSALVLRELSDLGDGIFGVQIVLRETLEGLLEELDRRREGFGLRSHG